MIVEEVSPALVDKISQLGSFIGNTPLFEIKNLVQKPGVQIFAKLEWQ